MVSWRECNDACLDGWKKALDFKSKSSRIQSFSFSLVNLFISILIEIYKTVHSTSMLDLIPFDSAYSYIAISLTFNLFSLVSFVATISLTIRRLRDVGRRWLWVFVFLASIVNLIFILV